MIPQTCVPQIGCLPVLPVNNDNFLFGCFFSFHNGFFIYSCNVPDQGLLNSDDETKFVLFNSGSITHFWEFLTCFTHCGQADGLDHLRPM